MVKKGETVDMVMVVVPTREVTARVEAVMGTGEVTMVPMVVEVTVGVEAATPRKRFGRPFLVRV